MLYKCTTTLTTPQHVNPNFDHTVYELLKGNFIEKEQFQQNRLEVFENFPKSPRKSFSKLPPGKVRPNPCMDIKWNNPILGEKKEKHNSKNRL